jgi:ubiquitin-protein ligase
MSRVNWWGTPDSVSTRLRLEVDLMRATFADTFRLVVPKHDLLYWIGDVEINLRGIPQRLHTMKIVYPAEYPNRPAEAYVLQPNVYSEKHQYEDGQLCLFNPKDGITYGWNPSTSTSVTVAGWAIQWLYSYYTWRATGIWPGIEERMPPVKDMRRNRRKK